MLYGAGAGHFFSTVAENTLPFNITLATDTTVHGRGFICHLTLCPRVVGGLEDMIKAGISGVEFSITGYIVHSPVCGIMSSQYKRVWQYQAKIISHYQQCRGLHALIIHCNNASPPALINAFERDLVEEGWLLKNFKVYYPDFRNSSCYTWYS